MYKFFRRLELVQARPKKFPYDKNHLWEFSSFFNQLYTYKHTLPVHNYLYRPKFPLIFLRIYLLIIESTH